jgi:hypothetical protein
MTPTQASYIDWNKQLASITPAEHVNALGAVWPAVPVTAVHHITDDQFTQLNADSFRYMTSEQLAATKRCVARCVGKVAL